MNQLIALLQKYLPQIIQYISDWMAKQPDPAPVVPTVEAQPEITLTLKRLECTATGIFSHLIDQNGGLICYVAEHAYNSLPKLPMGKFLVELGVHTLDHGGPQNLFCVQNVPGHQGICLHKGNAPGYDNVAGDSDGCLLLGTSFGAAGNQQIVMHSEVAFEAFYKQMAMYTKFNLIVC